MDVKKGGEKPILSNSVYKTKKEGEIMLYAMMEKQIGSETLALSAGGMNWRCAVKWSDAGASVVQE